MFRIVRNRALNHITRNKVDKHAVHTDDLVTDAWNTLAMLDYEGTVTRNDRIIQNVGIEEVLSIPRLSHHECERYSTPAESKGLPTVK